MKKFALSVSLLSHVSLCTLAQAADVTDLQKKHAEEQAGSGIKGAGFDGPAKRLCDSGEGLNIKKEIQTRTLEYLDNLNEAVGAGGSSLPSAQKEAKREGSKLRLLQIMSEYDASCFQGVADLSSLCPQLQSETRLLKADDSLQMLGDGFKLVRKKVGNGAFGAWQIQAPNGAQVGVAGDKNRDGFIDFISLSGKLSHDATVTESNRTIKGVVGSEGSWNIKERHTGIEKPIEIDLLKEPYLSSFGGDAADRCLDVPGNPATIVALAAKDHNWRASDSVVDGKAIATAALLGGWEGLQKGARGGTVGINNAANATVHGIATVGSLAGKGVKGLVWDLPIGTYKVMSDPVERKKFLDGVGSAINKLGAPAADAWQQCLVQTNNKFLESMACFDNKVASGVVKGLGAGWQGAGKIAGAIGAQIKKCWTEEGAEYQGEYFSECMGQVTFYAASSALGGGMAKAGADLALKGGKFTQVSGRAMAITGEWVVDQTGLATIGANKLQKLGDVMKSARNETAQLIDAGAKLDSADSLKINNYLKDYARHVSNPAKHPAPALDAALLKKVNATDAQALERWQANVADAIGTVSPKYKTAASEILASPAYKNAAKNGEKVPSALEIENLMKKIEKNTTIANKDVALDVVKKLKPEKIGDAVAQNSNLNFIKEMSDFHSKNGLGPVDADSVAKTINEWSPDAIDGLKQTLSDANRIMRENPLESHARAVESVLKKKGATSEQIMAVLPCTLGHGKH